MNMYREIVQSPQNSTKRSTCTYKDEGGFCRRYFDYKSKFRIKKIKPLSMVPKGTVDV